MTSATPEQTRRAVHALRSHLRAATPRSVLFITAVVLSLVAIALDRVATTLVLTPAAYFLFHTNARPATPGAAVPADAPAITADVVIGAADPYGKQSETDSGLTPVDYASLPMRRPEMDLMLSYIMPTDSYLEYGACATALHVAPRVSSAIAVAAADPSACTAVRDAVSNSVHNPDNLKFVCAGPHPEHDPVAHPHVDQDDDATASYTRFHSFVDAPLVRDGHEASPSSAALPESRPVFDKVFINGPARLACALRILPHLRPSSRVFLHDAFAHPARYAPLLDYYVEVSRVVAYGGGPEEPAGLLVLRPRMDAMSSNASLELSAQTIVALEHIGARSERAELQGSGDRTATPANFESAMRFFGSTNSSGYEKEAHNAAVIWRNSADRIVLDLIALPLLVACYYICQYVYSQLFEDSIKAHSLHLAFSLPLYSPRIALAENAEPAQECKAT